MLAVAFFIASAGAGLIGLALVDLRKVPPITGTCALVLTLAALGAAIVR
ncbi:hypothetical protein [Streptomyces sp. PBH53]|nr:hypothetical protein [Streptomyces sp. PBH53]